MNLIDVSFRKRQRPCHQPPILIERPRKQQEAAQFFLALVLVAAGFGWWWIHRSVPPLDGRIPLAGLRRPVEVRFDRFAVPHVFAGSDADAWRAVGYLQARDRLWQMELYRRAASGRLSELLGEATLAIDQRFLTLGLRLAAEREWERTPPDLRTAFESYAAGVNAAMAGVAPHCRSSTSCSASRLSHGRRSIRWRSASSSRGGSARTTGPSCCRYALVEELGPRALELFPGSPEWAPTILETGTGSRGSGGRKG